MPNVPISKSNTRRAVWSKTDGKCWYRGEQTNPWGDFSIDHFQPITLGGTDDIENLVPSCSKCNSRKASLPIEGFRDRVARLEGTIFTPEQLTYLDSKGITVPEPEKHIFYYEKMGL